MSQDTTEKESKFNEEDLRDHETSAGIIITDSGYCILDHVKHDMLTFPIGKVHSDQNPYDGLKMEMFEELDIRVQKAKELFNYKRVYDFDGHKVNVNTHVFIIQKYTGKIRNKEPKKHRNVLFMSLTDINRTVRKIADCVMEYIKWYKRNGGLNEE